MPLIVVSVSTAIIYTFLNWLLLIKLQVFNVEDIYVNLILPAVLSWGPILIWIKPRIKLLKLNSVRDNDLVMGLLIITWLTIALPIMFAQSYLVTATGKLTRLNRMSEIIHLPATRYYTVKQYYIGKRFVHVKPVFAVTGKGKSTFEISIYASIPVFDHLFPDTMLISRIRDSNAKAMVILNNKVSTMQVLKKLPADSINIMRYLNPTLVMPRYGDTGKYGAVLVLTKGFKLKDSWKLPPFKIYPSAWLAFKSQSSISNSLSIDEKKKYYQIFLKQSEKEFREKKFDRFVYLQRLSDNYDYRNYKEAINLGNDIVDFDLPVLEAIDEPFSQRNGNKLAWMFGSFSVGTIFFSVILFFIKPRTEPKTRKRAAKKKLPEPDEPIAD